MYLFQFNSFYLCFSKITPALRRSNVKLKIEKATCVSFHYSCHFLFVNVCHRNQNFRCFLLVRKNYLLLIMVIAFTEKDPKVDHSSVDIRKIHERRATKAVLPNDPMLQQLKKDKDKTKIKMLFKSPPKWWQKASIKYA